MVRTFAKMGNTFESRIEKRRRHSDMGLVPFGWEKRVGRKIRSWKPTRNFREHEVRVRSRPDPLCLMPPLPSTGNSEHRSPICGSWRWQPILFSRRRIPTTEGKDEKRLIKKFGIVRVRGKGGETTKGKKSNLCWSQKKYSKLWVGRGPSWGIIITYVICHSFVFRAIPLGKGGTELCR